MKSVKLTPGERTRFDARFRMMCIKVVAEHGSLSVQDDPEALIERADTLFQYVKKGKKETR